MKVNLRTRNACLQLALGLLVTGAALPQQTSNTPPLVGLTPDHATISAGDIQKESAWYQSVLGFKVSQSFTNGEGAPIQILTIPGYRLDLLEYKGSNRATYTYSRNMTQGWIHLVFTSTRYFCRVQIPAGFEDRRDCNQKRQGRRRPSDSARSGRQRVRTISTTVTLAAALLWDELPSEKEANERAM
jgi:catechol 2,3-dioxygenase-like lactoylglutathione lyase family enzyme